MDKVNTIPFLQMFPRCQANGNLFNIIASCQVVHAVLNPIARRIEIDVQSSENLQNSIDSIKLVLIRAYRLEDVFLRQISSENDTNKSFNIEVKSSADVVEQAEQQRDEKLKEATAIAIKTEQKKSVQKKNTELIYGKRISGKVIPMKELELDLGTVCVVGRIFKSDNKELKKRDAWILNYYITDETNSISVSFFVEKKDAEPIIEALKIGNYIKVEGKLSISSYTNELELKPYAIAHAEEPEKRKDLSEEKRVELHLHTRYSNMDGLTDVTTVVKRAISWGHKAIAITDHGVAQAFPEACKAGGDKIKIIYGTEAYLINDEKDWFASTSQAKRKTKYRHLILLAKNQSGLRNLYKLISISHLEHFQKRPLIPKSLVDENREGLIIGSACEAGELFQALVEKLPWESLKEIASWYDFLEIQPVCNNMFMIEKGLANDIADLQEYNKQILKLAKELGKPCCATGDVHFLEPQDEIYRHILLSSKGFNDADRSLPLYFKTTDEMLEEFSYLGEEDCYKVVIENPNNIAKMCDRIKPLPNGLFAPKLENSAEELEHLVYSKAHELYGDDLPPIVQERIDLELPGIIQRKYDVIYMSAQKLVKNSLDHGYLVGSRGSVGSSIVAFLSGITEVNSLPPHYRCPKCKYSDFDVDTKEYGCGVDLPNKLCPKCGTKLVKDGFNIPFETFLGYGGVKVPDIDLNFSGEYQAKAHRYTFELFGEGHVFKAGTVGTVAEKTALLFVKKYLAKREKKESSAEETRLALGCTNVKRSTGQHPGGMVVIPRDKEIYDFCPVQHPADDVNSDIITTHFEYHSMESNLLKLDMLGHDDPTMIRMLQDITHIDPHDIPLDDPETMSLFCSSKALGFENDEVIGVTGAVAIPEFGTPFTRQMLIDTQPKNFNTLLRLSGFSHGTDVWLGNAKDLILNGTASVTEAIGCRDDIMIYLISMGCDKLKSFKFMEAVRKGKLKNWPDGIEEEMRSHNIPEWYIDSCRKIKYLFPKAHAVAYVMMAYRIAYFKVHDPLAFYATYFSIRAKAVDATCMFDSLQQVKAKIKEINSKDNATDLEDKMLTTLEVCYEMYLRGYSFKKMNIFEMQATRYGIDREHNALIPSFTSIPGIGDIAAEATYEALQARQEKSFVSIEEFAACCNKLNETNINMLKQMGALDGLPETSQVDLFCM